MIERFMQSFSFVFVYFDDSTAVFAATVGVAMTAMTLSILFLLYNVFNPARRRVRTEINSAPTGSTNKAPGKIDQAITPVKSVVLPKSDKEITEIRKRLISAGYRHEGSMAVYYVWKLALGLIFGIGALFTTTFFPTLTSIHVVFIAGVSALVGMIIPSAYLDNKVQERKRAIINGFPDMLDMLVACSEAGLGLNAALQRVTNEMGITAPELAEELELVNVEILAGVDRVQALRGFAQRTDIPEISGFVAMLSQSVKFGTGIAETLRIYSEDFRDRRMQKAEEAAAKIGTKLLFPLVLCLFPAFFVVAVGPAIISIMEAFATTG